MAKREYYEDARRLVAASPLWRSLGYARWRWERQELAIARCLVRRLRTSRPRSSRRMRGRLSVVPAAAGKDAQSSKLITERVNERGQSEKLVSREEQPIDKPATVVLPQAVQQSALGSGVVGSEPKKVRTIAIRPDQPADGMPQGVAPVAATAPTRSPAQARAAAPPAPRPSADNSISEPEPSATSATPARGAPPVRQATPAPNVPLSLTPDARTQERAQPSQTAAVPPQAAAPAPRPAVPRQRRICPGIVAAQRG